MKKFFSTILFALCVGSCFAQEIIVTPSNRNGWDFGTSSPHAKNSAAWFLGYMGPAPQIGRGDLWIYSGNGDGIGYGQTLQYRGIPLKSLSRLSYASYTPRGMGNIAPTMNLCVDITGDSIGDIWLEYNPKLNGIVSDGMWSTWSPLQGRWWNSKYGSGDVRPLSEWLAAYPNAIIDIIRLQAGTWSKDSAAFWGQTWYGIDTPVISVGNGIALYNFEPDAPGTTKPPTAPSVGSLSNTVTPYVVVNPLSIGNPSYYIDKGEAVQKPAPQPTQPQDVKKPDPYKLEDSAYVPVLFEGNTALKKVLSQLSSVGNPDETIKRDDIKITEGGAFLFGGVPFYIPNKKNNTWDTNEYADDVEHKLTIPVKLSNVVELRTIMGLTYATGAKGTVFLEFRGNKGAFYRKELVVNQDIRDFRTSNFSKIVPPTQKVWSRPLMQLPNQGKDWEMFLDEQTITLPAEFASQELDTVTIVDRGKHNAQRSFLVGVTAKVKTKKLDK